MTGLFTTGREDELFDADLAQKEYRILKDYYEENPENLQFHIFTGTHEFCPEDEGIEQLLMHLK